jgi:hypothetical protein
MTPNPTARPFLVGALLFLALIAFWPGRASAAAGAGHTATSSLSADRGREALSTSSTLMSRASGVNGL